MAPPTCLAVVAVSALLIPLLLAAAAPHHQLDPARWASDQDDDGGRGAAATMLSACTVEAQEEGCNGEAATRRQLRGSHYIGYDALRRNAVPCSYRGASYYNCRPGGQANPYSRGCSAITRCRG